MEALGPVLIVFAIPLIFRWIPPNRFFGLRIPATHSDVSVWYDANALVGRHMFALGLVMVLLEFVLPASSRIAVLRVVGTVGFVIMIVVDWRTANRWRRERQRHTS
jgi:uncharacterized membrane protein